MTVTCTFTSGAEVAGIRILDALVADLMPNTSDAEKVAATRDYLILSLVLTYSILKSVDTGQASDVVEQQTENIE